MKRTLAIVGLSAVILGFLLFPHRCPEQAANYRSVFMAGAQYAILIYDTTAHHPTEEQLNAGADSIENGTWQQHLEEVANQ